MPAGTFQSDLTPDQRAGGSYGGTSTGSAAPSQPNYLSGGTIDQRNQAGWNQVYQNSGGAQRGYGQFPMGQGPSATMPGSIAQYPNVLYNNPQMSAASSIAQSLYGPQSLLLQQQLARQQSQLLDPRYGPGAQADYARSALYRDTDLARQGLGLDRRANELERGLAQGQLGNLGKLRAVLAKQRTLAERAKSLGVGEAKDMAGRKQWDLRSQLTARGAHSTVANERGTGRINADLMYQLEGIDQQYRNTLLGLTEKGIGYDNQQLALENKLANVGLDAQRLGLSQQQLQNSLADGLYQIGLGEYTNINQLLDAMGGTNTQQAQMAATIFGEIWQLSGLPQDALNAMYASLGIGGGGAKKPTKTGY